MGSHNIDIDLLAPIIFLKNPTNLPIALNLTDPLKNSKDIFYFCTDIFFKGLFYMNHNNNNKVIVNDLSLEQIYQVIAKLKHAKINTNIKIGKPEVDQKLARTIINSSLNDVKNMADNQPLMLYELHIPINNVLYVVSFNLVS